ncbi:8654_t:CDS:2, partial [Funneliformis caledonium]
KNQNDSTTCNKIYQQEMQIIRTAFKINYDNPRGCSSGTGKSRLVVKLTKKCFIIYCYFQEISNISYPSRSGIADLLLPTAIVSKPNSQRNITLYLSYLISSTDNDFWKKVGINMREIQDKLTTMKEVEYCERMRGDCFIPLQHALQYLLEYGESYGRTFTLLLDTISIGLKLMLPFYLMDTINDIWTAFNPPATTLNSQALHQDILTIQNFTCFKLVYSTEFSNKLSMIKTLSQVTSLSVHNITLKTNIVDLIIPVLLASSSSVVFTSSSTDDSISQNTHQYPEDFAFQPESIDELFDDLTFKIIVNSSMKTTRLSSISKIF